MPDQVTIPKDRASLALQATYQVDALCDIMKRESARGDTAFELVMPSLLARMKEVNSVAMSAIGGDNGHTTEEMHAVIHGGTAA